MEHSHFRDTECINLIVDSIFHYHNAKRTSCAFLQNRFSRSSIISSALVIECIANCLLDSSDFSKQYVKDLDKLNSMTKIETYLHLHRINCFDNGRCIVQQIKELIKLRNSFVHPKVTRKKVDIQKSQIDNLNGFEATQFEMSTGHSSIKPALGVSTQSNQWTSQDSHTCLLAVRDFLYYLFIETLQFESQEIVRVVYPQTVCRDIEIPTFNEELPDEISVAQLELPRVYQELEEELSKAKESGIDFDFLRDKSEIDY